MGYLIPIRRNPQSVNPRRWRGPWAPPVITDPAQQQAFRAAMSAWALRFKQRRGCPAGVHDDYMNAIRRKGRWYVGAYDVPRPDGGPPELP